MKICKRTSTIEKIDRDLLMYFSVQDPSDGPPLLSSGSTEFKNKQKQVILHATGFRLWSSLPKVALFAKHLCGLTDRLDERLENKSESTWRQTEYYG